MRFNHQFKNVNSGAGCREYECGLLSARIDFISESAIRVAVYKKGKKMLPTFTVNPTNELTRAGRDKLSTEGFDCVSPEVSKSDKGERFVLPCGIEMTLELDNFVLSYSLGGKRLFSDRAPLAYNLEGEFGAGVCHYLSRDDGEHILGLGDKSGKIDKAGKSFRVETADSMGFDAESTDPLYKHVPFYICENSVGCYGIYYDTSDNAYFDFGREINNYYEHFKFFKSDDDCLVYYVFFGSKLEILQQYGRLTGKQAFPPKWSFDYCASTMAYTDAENAQEEMYAFLDKIKELDIACGGFYLSSGYTSIGKLRCVFNWNRDKFPNPTEFVGKFKQNKIHIIPNIKPAFLTSHPMYDELSRRGFFVKNPDNTPYVTQFWDGVGSYIDFTNPEAFDFWAAQVTEKLLDYGIDATWNDNNEFDIKALDAAANGFGGVTAAYRMKPVLTYLMVLSSYTAQMKKNPGLRPFLSTRSGSSAVRRLAQTWSGDNYTSFHDLRFCHYVGMTMSLSGFYFYGHDLGGFSGDMPSKELLLRWMQHGVFEPRFTIHSWNEDGSATMPWSYESEIPAARKILAQRKRLLPYIYSCAYEAVENELPLQAPPYLYFNDKNIDINTASFMLGRSILAECVLDGGETGVNVYLPADCDWYLGGKKYSGGQTVRVDIPYDGEVDFFVKSGSVLPTDEGKYGFKGEEKLVFTVYPIENGEFTDSFFADDGVSFEYLHGSCTRLEFEVKCDEKTVFVNIKNLGKIRLEPTVKLVCGDDRQLVINNLR